MSCEKYGKEVLKNRLLISVVKNDINIIKELFSLCRKLDQNDGQNGELSKLFLEETNDKIIENLVDAYFQQGCGDLHRSLAVWIRPALMPLRG